MRRQASLRLKSVANRVRSSTTGSTILLIAPPPARGARTQYEIESGVSDATAASGVQACSPITAPDAEHEHARARTHTPRITRATSNLQQTGFSADACVRVCACTCTRVPCTEACLAVQARLLRADTRDEGYEGEYVLELVPPPPPPTTHPRDPTGLAPATSAPRLAGQERMRAHTAAVHS